MTRLHTLVINDMQITDLSSLKGLRLNSLRMRGRTRVADLSPLREMPLKELWLDYQPALHAEALCHSPVSSRSTANPGRNSGKLRKSPDF